MGLIKDILFGRKVTFYDDKIGELTARVKNENPSINYTWTCEFKLDGQKGETFFILEGNSTGPYNDQIKSVHQIVDSINEIISNVDKELKGRNDIKQIFKNDWINEFYLAAINPYNPDTLDIGRKFEINFEPVKKDNTDYIGLIWDNGSLTEIVAE